MNLTDAMERVRQAPEDAEAWAVIRTAVEQLAARETSEADLREDAVRRVLEKLEDRVLTGDLPAIHAPWPWLRKAVHWRVCDVVRRRDTRARHDAREAEKRAAEARARPEPIPPETWLGLERVFEVAVRRRDAWQKDHLRRAWPQVKRLMEENETLREIVIRDESLDPTDDDAIRRAVQRAHKAHERTRQAFREAVAWMEHARHLDPDEAADLLRAIQHLKRRQTRPRSCVPEGGPEEAPSP